VRQVLTFGGGVKSSGHPGKRWVWGWAIKNPFCKCRTGKTLKKINYLGV
jgi:hypothetical protein